MTKVRAIKKEIFKTHKKEIEILQIKQLLGLYVNSFWCFKQSSMCNLPVSRHLVDFIQRVEKMFSLELLGGIKQIQTQGAG